jgi:hypothetical protein
VGVKMAINNKYSKKEKDKIRLLRKIREKMINHRKQYQQLEVQFHNLLEECPNYKYKGFP